MRLALVIGVLRCAGIPSTRTRSILQLGVTALLLCACAGAPPATTGLRTSSVGQAAARRVPGTIVLDEQVLAADPLSVLHALRTYVPSISIDSRAECPAVALRQATGSPAPPSASIYVNGMRAVNTCVLADLPARDVSRIEVVYPSGMAAHPEYSPSTSGLILILLRTQ